MMVPAETAPHTHMYPYEHSCGWPSGVWNVFIVSLLDERVPIRVGGARVVASAEQQGLRSTLGGSGCAVSPTMCGSLGRWGRGGRRFGTCRGVRDEDGFLYIVDRLKDMIVSGGENIASSEVERVLYEHDAVLEAAVVGRPDDRWGEVPVAFVVLSQDATATADALLEHCRAQLARFKVRTEVTFLDALPRNPSGKVLKRELRGGE
jgi:AMP-binding enzyme C-terminal domain